MPAGHRSAVHRTRTVDYGIVLEGEVYLVMEGSETLLHPGDIVVQRGTNHAWDNRSDTPAHVVFILLAAEFAPELTASKPNMALVL
jgi:naringenin degradation protein FdeH